MTYVIFTILGLAFLHFIYEGILAPSFRLKLRFELFSLRDELRNLKYSEEISEDMFRALQSGINNSIKLLARTDIVTVLTAHHKIENDPKLSQLRDKQFRKFEEDLNEHTRPILHQCTKLFLLSILVNNGMVILYLLPFFLGLAVSLLLTRSIFRKVAEFMDIVFIPENQVDNVVPSDIFAAA